MHIPALEAERSLKFGIVRAPDVAVLAGLHDEGVNPMKEQSRHFESPKGGVIRTAPRSGVLLENLFSRVHTSGVTLSDFSEGFRQEAAKAYGIARGNADDYEDAEIQYDALSNQIEQEFLAYIIQSANDKGTYPESIHAFLHRNYLCRNQERDHHLSNVGENVERPFSEGDYSSQHMLYYPNIDHIEDGFFHLNFAEFTPPEGTDPDLRGGETQATLWFRYTTPNGDEEERLVAVATEGYPVVYSRSVEFGETSEETNLTSEFTSAITSLVDGEAVDTTPLSTPEEQIIDTLAGVDIEDTETQTLINRFL